MHDDIFDHLQAQLNEQGAAAMFDVLTSRLTADQKYHELFDVLLMRSRHALGLPVILTTSIDDLPEPLRSQVEDEYLAACRQVGKLLLDEGRLREAWMYLRPVGDKALVSEAMAKIEPNDENVQDLIEIGLHEGVAPELGFALVLKQYGTCNAITTFEGALVGRPRADQQAAAGLLLKHLHAELLANVRADVQRQEGQPPQEATLGALVTDRDWLFAENNYHIDTTHLASTIRFARVLEDPQMLELAQELCEYGRRLSRQFQFAGDEPFADMYPSHALFFAAQRGQQVDEALAYFRQRAESVDVATQGTGPAEVYIVLLTRLKRHQQAIDVAIELTPGVRTSSFAPNLLELSRLSGNYDRLMEVCRQRGDLVSFTAGLIESGAS